jgi:hypothetical protein
MIATAAVESSDRSYIRSQAIPALPERPADAVPTIGAAILATDFDTGAGLL